MSSAPIIDSTLSAYEPPQGLSPATPTRDTWVGAPIAAIEASSPAEEAGLEPGMLVTHANGAEIRDVIDWDWEADGPEVFVEGVAYPGTDREFEFECELTRELGQDWGITFDGAIFDGMRLCRNRCLFCFMAMLPKGMRGTLYMRDDDYRLSFLQGNFVTLTNMTDEDVERVITHALSPLNVSVHAITPEVRRRLIGRHADRGVVVLERLLEAGIEIHAQIVLVPNENDGEELARTLEYVIAHPLITSMGIVPLGFTKHQRRFTSSFSSPELAQGVIDVVEPFQRRCRELFGRTVIHLADEFYLNAHVDPPTAESYDGFPQYYDGIGMVRTFLDDLTRACSDSQVMAAMAGSQARHVESAETVWLVSGSAASSLVRRAVSRFGASDWARVIEVKNDYFGGNVDVSGLLTASDIMNQLPEFREETSHGLVALPDVMLNSDRLTLDGLSADELIARVEERGVRCIFICASVAGIKDALLHHIAP